MSEVNIRVHRLIVATVLHLDKDFDLVAAVTRQPVERLVESRG